MIVDDHAMVRAGLRMLIEQEPHLHIVGEAGDLIAAVGLAAAFSSLSVASPVPECGATSAPSRPVITWCSKRPCWFWW